MTEVPHIAITGISSKVADALLRYHSEKTEITGLVHKRTQATDGLANVIGGFDITEERGVHEVVRTLARNKVRTIINCAAQVDLDGVEKQRYALDPTALSAYSLNARSAELLAEACAAASTGG